MQHSRNSFGTDEEGCSRACFQQRELREWVLREHLQRLALYALAQPNLYERYTL